MSSKMNNFWDDLEFNDLNSQLMVMAAFRYCLGRRSYIVGSCIDWIYKYRKQFERNTICVIVRDIVEALMDGQAGSEHCDVPGWTRLAKSLFDEMCPEDKDWCLRAVAHRDKDWPL